MGVARASVIVFLRTRLGVGEADGDSAAEGDALLSTGGVGSVVFCARRFVGEEDPTGVPVSSCD